MQRRFVWHHCITRLWMLFFLLLMHQQSRDHRLLNCLGARRPNLQRCSKTASNTVTELHRSGSQRWKIQGENSQHCIFNRCLLFCFVASSKAIVAQPWNRAMAAPFNKKLPKNSCGPPHFPTGGPPPHSEPHKQQNMSFSKIAPRMVTNTSTAKKQCF